MCGDNFVNNEIIRKGVANMIIMDVKINNLYAFKNFHMNMSYPKKIVGSTIDNEFLETRPNFRYKKLNIIMGSNATGKTSLGKVLMLFANFFKDGDANRFKNIVNGDIKDAKLQIDFVTDEDKLFRFVFKSILTTDIMPNGNYHKEVKTNIFYTPINKKDNYETCASRLENGDFTEVNYEDIDTSGWCFSYPKDSDISDGYKIIENDKKYICVLENVLKTLDSSIQNVKKIDEVDNAYAIKYPNHTVLIHDGKILEPEKLSSGTKAGIEISYNIASLLLNRHDLYYCDELFSYINSDIEKAVLSIMIDTLKGRKQMFFTTHNTDILDMQLPMHSYVFLKKTIKDAETPIQCIDASEYLKRNTDSLRNAVENDLFNTSPNLDNLFNLIDLYNEAIYEE